MRPHAKALRVTRRVAQGNESAFGFARYEHASKKRLKQPKMRARAKGGAPAKATPKRQAAAAAS